jgi:cyclic-di-GMP-binding protein
MNAYRRLADGLPERKAGRAEGVPTDARSVRDWVSALPLANRAETSRLLLDVLQRVNGMKIDPAQRVVVLEALRQPVADLLGFIEQQVLGSSFPLPANKQGFGQRMQIFHAELATGYRIAVVEQCAPSGSVPFLRGKRVALALQRAIYHHGAALAACYLLYLKPVPGSWAPLHLLARFADDTGLADKDVSDPLLSVTTDASALYRQALLLAVCNPYRFPQREQLEIRAAALDLAALCRIGRTSSADGFLLPEDEDRGPGYLPSERSDSTDSGWRFDVSSLREKIERQLGEGAREVILSVPGRRSARLAAELASRCLGAWGSVAERTHQRLAAGHQLDSIIGLSALHFFLAGEKDFETFMRQVHGVGAILAAGESAAWAGGGAEHSRPGVFRARVMDQSLGGYQLAWDRDHAVRARVGEMVGLAVPAESGEERDWMLAIIRWLRYEPEGGLEAGVELLARRARAVGLRPPGNGETRPALRGIEFHHARDKDDGALHVLAPAILERHGETIELTRGAGPEGFLQEAGIIWMNDIRMVEHTGDYLHLAGTLDDHGGDTSTPESA